MIFCKEMRDLLYVASEIAKDMDAKYIEVPHIVSALLRYDSLDKILRENKIDVNTLKADVEEEAEQQPKLKAEKVEMFERTNTDRKMRLSMSSQKLLNKAGQLAVESSWRTGDIEMSHLVTALFMSNASCAFSSHFKDERTKVSVSDDLVIFESAQRGMKIQKVVIVDDDCVDNDDSEDNGSESDSKMEFCADLVKTAKKDNKPFIGRESELSNLLSCLARRDKPNAILVGAPGVGKTDIVRGLAKRIVEGNIPDVLKDTSLYSVDLPAMLAGSEFRGSFEKRLKGTLNKATSSGNRPILFLDEIHTVLGAGKGIDSTMDAANILKPYLTDGSIRVIGATTDEEYRKYVEKDAAFMRRFQKIDVSEPTASETIKIISGVKTAYEEFHGMTIPSEAIKAAVNGSCQYMHDRFLPDKAIDIIDQTCARIRIASGKKVSASDMEDTISKICKIPIQSMHEDSLDKVRGLDKKLKMKVFGQNEAIDKLTRAIQISKTGLGDPMKPIGSFLFVGPSGVGKTEIAKQLAANLGIDFIRFDMSEYGEAHSVAKFIGSPAGYVGYDDGGILIEKVRKTPHAVILFDEIEKAHPDVYKIFLQMLDYGILTDNKGRKADFRNTVIIMTSNAGNSVNEAPKLGFGRTQDSDRKANTERAVSDLMPPELRGRISEIVTFNSLNDEIAEMVVNKELSELTTKLKAKKISVTYSDSAIKEIVKRGVSASYGAREIQKVIDRDIRSLFVDLIMSKKIADSYLVTVNNGEFKVDVAKNSASKTKTTNRQKVK